MSKKNCIQKEGFNLSSKHWRTSKNICYTHFSKYKARHSHKIDTRLNYKPVSPYLTSEFSICWCGQQFEDKLSSVYWSQVISRLISLKFMSHTVLIHIPYITIPDDTLSMTFLFWQPKYSVILETEKWHCFILTLTNIFFLKCFPYLYHFF